MTYNGTVTRVDPQLVETLDDVIPGHTVYVLRDWDAENPRLSWDRASALVGTSDRHIEPDGAGDSRHDAIRRAYNAWWYTSGSGYLLIERYLRIFHDAVAVEIHTTPDNNYVGMVTKADAEKVGWGTPEQALAGLRSEIKEYQQWCDGEVYQVIVVNHENDEEASLSGVYNDFEFDYIHEVAKELAAEIA